MDIYQLRIRRVTLQRAIERAQKRIDQLNLTAEIGMASRIVPSLERQIESYKAELAAMPAEPERLVAIGAVAPSRHYAESSQAAAAEIEGDGLDIPPFLQRTPA
jgi:hypothetical protein